MRSGLASAGLMALSQLALVHADAGELRGGASAARATPQDGETSRAGQEHDDAQPLEPLRWLVGQWKTAPDAAIPAAAQGRWSADGHFLLLDYQVSPPGGPAISSAERIAWDPVGKCFRSWTFRGDGGFGQANWVTRETGWMIRYSGTSGDGRPFSATLMLSLGTAGQLNLSAIERWVGEENQPDLKLELRRELEASVTDPAIEGPLWELVRLASGPLRDRNRPTLRLEQGQVEAFGGINRIAGRYQRNGESLRFRDLLSTLMGGSDADSELEQEFSAMLESVNRAQVEAGELRLYRGTDEVARFRPKAAEPKNTPDPTSTFEQVMGKRWELVELKGNPVDGERMPTLMFDAGRVDGFGGINRLNGSYNQTQGSLTFGPLRSTRMGGSPAAMRLESQFATILSQVERFEIQDGQLVLLGDTEVLARFRVGESSDKD